MNEKYTRMRPSAILAQTLLASYFLFPSTAFAYVDPGSGSVIVTTVLGFIAAIGYTFRKFFYNMKRKFSSRKTDEEQAPEENNDSNSAS